MALKKRVIGIHNKVVYKAYRRLVVWSCYRIVLLLAWPSMLIKRWAGSFSLKILMNVEPKDYPTPLAKYKDVMIFREQRLSPSLTMAISSIALKRMAQWILVATRSPCVKSHPSVLHSAQFWYEEFEVAHWRCCRYLQNIAQPILGI